MQPAANTSHTPTTLEALEMAEAFMAGFEGDGVQGRQFDEKLETVRATIALERRRATMASATNDAPGAGTDEAPFEWAIVEIFGHRKHAGRAREEGHFGAKMLRVDVPSITLTKAEDDKPSVAAVTAWVTHYYGGSAIFSFTLTDEPTVMRVNRPYEPPSRYSLPAPTDDDETANVDDMEF